MTKLAVNFFVTISTFAASVRLCMGSRRGFICRLRMGNVQPDPMTANHTVRLRQRNTLGPASDGHHYAVVHITGYVKNWPPSGRWYFSEPCNWTGIISLMLPLLLPFSCLS